ncbi:hypothetical protein [Maridesulfovibrio zosterae]|uniref:hypothetical protein n=1 Tax=Maridesulfovibrio zosterae TaxID=82171 RepID=UPI000409E184|nr:hypothetical protein [Maridesulfovibrio zosterae]
MEISGTSQAVVMPKQRSGAESNANDIKNIKKAKMEREVMADPSLASKLVATKSTPTYNTNGSVIQATSNSLGEV